MTNNSGNDLVAAQNRTTHAVRALGAFLLYSSLFNLIGGVIIGIAYVSATTSYEGIQGVMGGIEFGVFVIAVGYIVALGIGLSELSKSKLYAPGAEPQSYAASQAASAAPAPATQAPVTASADAAASTSVACPNCSAVNTRSRSRCRVCDGLLG